jgi:8-oxo-dGTP pyrophosphatase MutT (NUDIX family)
MTSKVARLVPLFILPYYIGMSDKTCDHASVGVVIRDPQGRFALLKRAKYPIGIAPAAGHIDDHGSPEQAARDEVYEELGLSTNELQNTAIQDRRVDNKCRRIGGNYHQWYVYNVTVEDTALRPSKDETKGAAWFDKGELQTLADRTAAYHAGKIAESEWEANPGLEEVWVPFMRELGYIDTNN